MNDVVANALADAPGCTVHLEPRTGQGHSGAQAYRCVLPSGDTLS